MHLRFSSYWYLKFVELPEPQKLIIFFFNFSGTERLNQIAIQKVFNANNFRNDKHHMIPHWIPHLNSSPHCYVRFSLKKDQTLIEIDVPFTTLAFFTYHWVLYRKSISRWNFRELTSEGYKGSLFQINHLNK